METELTHLRKRLRNEGEKTLAYFTSLPPEHWQTQVYTEGSHWRIHQILAHFISTESTYQYYLEDVLQGGPGAPMDMDIDKFNEVEVARLGSKPVDDLLDEYRNARQKTLDMTHSMQEIDLMRKANHPWFGEQTIGWFLRLIYRHNTLHLQDIRKAIQTGEPVPHSDAHRVGRNLNTPT